MQRLPKGLDQLHLIAMPYQASSFCGIKYIQITYLEKITSQSDLDLISQ